MAHSHMERCGLEVAAAGTKITEVIQKENLFKALKMNRNNSQKQPPPPPPNKAPHSWLLQEKLSHDSVIMAQTGSYLTLHPHNVQRKAPERKETPGVCWKTSLSFYPLHIATRIHRLLWLLWRLSMKKRKKSYLMDPEKLHSEGRQSGHGCTYMSIFERFRACAHSRMYVCPDGCSSEGSMCVGEL